MRFSSLPLDRKLLLSMLLTSLVALLLAGSAFVAYEVYSYRRAAVRQLTALAGVTVQNVAGALAFDDPVDASVTLAALRAEQQVRAAVLYDGAGRPFAAYPADRSPGAPLAGSGARGHRFSGNTLEYTMPVQVGDARLGTLQLQMETSTLAKTLGFFTVVGLAIFLIAVLAGLSIARRLQRQISDPIIALSRTAGAVSAQHDYTVRAERAEQPEIRVLTDAFNQMLHRIEETQTHLQAQLGRLDLLQRTTRAIGERQDLPSILQVIVGRLESELPVDFACVARCDAGTNALVIEGLGARAAALAQRGGVQLHERIELEAGERKLCFAGIIYEPEVGVSAHPFARRLARGGLAAVVMAPLVTPDADWGVLVAGRTEPHSFSSPDTEFLQQLSDHASLAVRQARLTDDLKRAYDDLRQSQLTFAQQERLRALGQMASGIAHDINNAISPVTLYVTSLLEREPALTERGRRQLQTIERAVEDVTQTVQRMREFYRRRETPEGFAPVEINTLCREVIELTRARWDIETQERGAHIQLREEFSAQPVWVRGVAVEIRDALVNLVFNAADAMPASGVLTIHTSPRASREDLACVAVSDTGIGMDEATRARCLEPFFTTKGERGTGMGLAMVFGMVRRHGGELEIESAIGSGTTVRLLLPRSSPEGKLMPEPAVAAAQTPLRLLVIDDDPLLIQSLRDTLELEGHSVTVADGGQSGIDAFMAATSARKGHDVVITDLGMPHLDGRAVAAAVKAVEPGTPVILLTGWGARLAAEAESPVGVDKVLGKPPRLAELRAALAALGGKRQSD